MDIVLKIAELHPAALVDARVATIGRTELGVERMIISYLRQGQKIVAIKYYREQTGFGLKEAKKHVDNIAQKMGLNDSLYILYSLCSNWFVFSLYNLGSYSQTKEIRCRIMTTFAPLAETNLSCFKL